MHHKVTTHRKVIDFSLKRSYVLHDVFSKASAAHKSQNFIPIKVRSTATNYKGNNMSATSTDSSWRRIYIHARVATIIYVRTATAAAYITLPRARAPVKQVPRPTIHTTDTSPA